MLRLRRYRVLLICAFVITMLLYHVSRNSQWEHAQDVWHGKANPHTHPKPRPPPPPRPPPRPEHEHEQKPGHHGNELSPPKPPPPPPPPPPAHHHADDRPASKQEPPVRIPQLKTDDGVKGGYGLPTKAASPKPTTALASVPDRKPPSNHDSYPKQNEDGGIQFVDPADYQANTVPSTTTVHWQKPSEWFPVPAESLIRLPTGAPKPIPSVQFSFGKESPAAKEKREARLAKVKAEAQRAWSGYKKYAWTHDELKPVSKRSKDPFCGWAATLVDSLDTLWIMGLKEEFDDAVEAVKDIDFTTTPHRDDIPVFETIIRYLGGLVGAYDVTGGHQGKYRVLLDKALELAEILMSVFDTPNRMPILYYQWKPFFNKNPKRASQSVSVAELGSMSMEFTRLAQLTGEDKYYDAIARITDAFEEFQNRENATAIPGIFPQQLDASGCNRTATTQASTTDDNSGAAGKQTIDDIGTWQEPGAYGTRNGKHSKPDERVQANAEFGSAAGAGQEADLGFRQFDDGLQKRDGPPKAIPKSVIPTQLPEDWDCVPQGLTGAGWGSGSYSMGGSQDSTYEYFPKQYVLLGGLEAKYRSMHEKVADAVKKYLLFRPMAEGDPDILFSAKALSTDGTADNLSYEWEVTHLTCFLGGMFGLGGKLFDRPDDVEVAKKLADGCVWAYEVMPAGVMPEYATLLPCRDPDQCQYDQKAWYAALDPRAERRDKDLERYFEEKAEWQRKAEELKQREALRKQVEEKKRQEEAEKKAAADNFQGQAGAVNLPDQRSEDSSYPQLKRKEPPPTSGFQKRDFVESQPIPDRSQGPTVPGATEEKVKKLHNSLDLNSPAGSTQQDRHGNAVEQKPINDFVLPPEPMKPLSHIEYVTDRIKNEHIPSGFVTLTDKRYLLRPEAIESVWYMYRITGEPSWQEKGWRMFQAVIRATQTEIGHSAIDDVTSTSSAVLQLDSMESFWLAETLKYFYLLFSEPDVISLDEWVLNTEAHPFRRPTG
ncbi:hypothetical protein VTI74DRAFT_8609 [Chaetomium olivicolor]